MNDISVIRPSFPTASVASKAPVSTAPVEESGKDLPLSTAKSAKTESTQAANPVEDVDKVNSAAEVERDREAANKALEEAVDTANDFVQTVQRDLHFSIDDETERTVVKVVESSSGEIIRQIPNETFLELARKMKENGEVNLVNATG